MFGKLSISTALPMDCVCKCNMWLHGDHLAELYECVKL